MVKHRCNCKYFEYIILIVKPNVSKSDCSCNVSKPVICKFSNKSICKIINSCQVFNPVHESVVVNHIKHDNKQYFNVSSHRYGVTKSLYVRHILMTLIYFYELVLLFFIFHHSFCNSNVDNFFLRLCHPEQFFQE